MVILSKIVIKSIRVESNLQLSLMTIFSTKGLFNEITIGSLQWENSKINLIEINVDD